MESGYTKGSCTIKRKENTMLTEKQIGKYWDKKIKRICKIGEKFDPCLKDYAYWKSKPGIIMSLIDHLNNQILSLKKEATMDEKLLKIEKLKASIEKHKAYIVNWQTKILSKEDYSTEAYNALYGHVAAVNECVETIRCIN